MAVYVDMLINYGWFMRGRTHPSCHMIADTEEELHTMATRIGLKRSWYQTDSILNHYDLVESKRILAIQSGAIEIDRYQLIEKLNKAREQRKTNPNESKES